MEIPSFNKKLQPNGIKLGTYSWSQVRIAALFVENILRRIV